MAGVSAGPHRSWGSVVTANTIPEQEHIDAAAGRGRLFSAEYPDVPGFADQAELLGGVSGMTAGRPGPEGAACRARASVVPGLQGSGDGVLGVMTPTSVV